MTHPFGDCHARVVFEDHPRQALTSRGLITENVPMSAYAKAIARGTYRYPAKACGCRRLTKRRWAVCRFHAETDRLIRR